MDHEPQLVEEPVGQQRPDQGATAGDRDVLVRLSLEVGDLLGDVLFVQGRVVPFQGLCEGR